MLRVLVVRRELRKREREGIQSRGAPFERERETKLTWRIESRCNSSLKTYTPGAETAWLIKFAAPAPRADFASNVKG